MQYFSQFHTAFLLLLLAICVPQPVFAADAEDLLKLSGVQGGLIVHVGCGDGKLTTALRTNDRFIVQGLETDATKIAVARKHVRASKLYGPVSVHAFDGKRLPYIDNLVNLLVLDESAKLTSDEALRVLAPLGVVCAKRDGKWTKTVKPWPNNIDHWQQYLHGADNNAVAHDQVVGPPRHLQWVSDPLWSRSHMSIPSVVSMVSSHGRMFSIEDTASAENPFLPGRFSLIARDAFNGLVLWEKEFPQWEPITRYVKDMAVQLQRRVVAIDNVVYCTLGIDAPVTALDAATGKILQVYEGTKQTQEFAYDQGVLYLVVGDRMNAARYDDVKLNGKGLTKGGTDPKAPFAGAGFRRGYAPQTPNVDTTKCDIVAVDARSGKTLWKRDGVENLVGCTLAIRGTHAVYQSSGGLTCLDRQTGKPKWNVNTKVGSGDGTSANTVVLSDDAVYAKEGGSLVAYALSDGSKRWTSTIAGNYEKSADLFLVDGAVWTGGSGKPTRHDPKTGKATLVIDQRMTGPMGHDRCYRNFITDRYYINSKTGGADFLTFDGKSELPNYWLRGTCGLGIVPANGMLYVPPYACQCSTGAMLQNMNAVYAEKGLTKSNQPMDVEANVQLVKGSAFGTTHPTPDAKKRVDWPTYRGNNARTGHTSAKLSPDLKPAWTTKLGGGLTAITAAAGKAFVARSEAHTVYALNLKDGSVAWDYVAGGRVDSPPTYFSGMVMFGSRDGWVHCLRASDGELAWRFKDLPDKLICAFGQVESAWPVNGSVLVEKDIAYFVAGRSSFLDGGIFVYGLNPRTGEVVHRRQLYGPFDKETGFPSTGAGAFKADILVSDGERLYIRHRSLKLDLTLAPSPKPHVLPSAGFLDGTPHHRTYWTVGTGYGWTSMQGRPSGDILVMQGDNYYEMHGFPVHRHSYFDPRLNGYQLRAGKLVAPKSKKKTAADAKKKRRGTSKGSSTIRWTSNLPATSRAMLLAGDVVFVAGMPAKLGADSSFENYEAAYQGKLGGVLCAVSTADGSKLAEYRLKAAPNWDGLAATANGLLISTADGSVICFE